ncbi:hypothetical protein ABIC10_008278 [Bradyrhizobium sp. S3.2.12]
MAKNSSAKFLGRAVDQPLAELRQFAADLRLDLILSSVPPSLSARSTAGSTEMPANEFPFLRERQ